MIYSSKQISFIIHINGDTQTNNISANNKEVDELEPDLEIDTCINPNEINLSQIGCWNQLFKSNRSNLNIRCYLDYQSMFALRDTPLVGRFRGKCLEV